MTNLSLTSGQEAVLAFLQKYIADHGYPPSEREIAKGIGTKWIRGVQRHLAALEEKGFIRRGKGARTIELIQREEDQGLPILGQVAAGTPILAEENLSGRLSLDKTQRRWKGDFLLKVKGESMKEAGIIDGDYVVVKPQPDADSGEIVVALIGEEATVKRLIKNKKKVILEPENPLYAPIQIALGDEIKILGKVVGTLRLY